MSEKRVRQRSRVWEYVHMNALLQSNTKSEDKNFAHMSSDYLWRSVLLVLQMIGKTHRIEISPSDSLHKPFVPIVDRPGTEGMHMTQIKQSAPERALFLIREVSVRPRAQGASCWGDEKHARPPCYRLGHSCCTIRGGDSRSWRELFSYWWTKLVSDTCNSSHEGSLLTSHYGVEISLVKD